MRHGIDTTADRDGRVAIERLLSTQAAGYALAAVVVATGTAALLAGIQAGVGWALVLGGLVLASRPLTAAVATHRSQPTPLQSGRRTSRRKLNGRSRGFP